MEFCQDGMQSVVDLHSLQQTHEKRNWLVIMAQKGRRPARRAVGPTPDSRSNEPALDGAGAKVVDFLVLFRPQR
jgi:hypothetical protein